MKFILKALSFSLVSSVVFAAETNDCNEIKNYLENKSLDYNKTVEKCITDNQGKVVELKVLNYDLQEEDVNQILSYQSIQDLEYSVQFIQGEERDTPYSFPLLPHPGFSTFPSAIANLPELEKLNFNYNNFRRIKYSPDTKYITIENEFLKLSKLKILTLHHIELSNDNVKELSKLNNLEELNLYQCLIDSDELESFEDHENLTKLSLYNYMGSDGNFPNRINKLKSLKQLNIENCHCDKSSYDFNGLENLESFNYVIPEACDLDLSKLNKLSELSIKSSNYVFFNGIATPMDLKLPNSLKSLNLFRLTLTSDNYNVVANLPNLEELTLYCYGDSNEIDIESLKSHDKLRKLTINSFTGDNIVLKNNKLDFLNELVNLTYLELSNDSLTEISQLKDLKNLKYLDLSNNVLQKFPEALATLKNIEYINLSSNIIKDELPKSLSQLENLKYFNIEGNENVTGNVLTNKSLENCIYSGVDNLCIPKGYELNCLTSDENVSFKTCKEEFNTTTKKTTKKTTTKKTTKKSTKKTTIKK